MEVEVVEALILVVDFHRLDLQNSYLDLALKSVILRYKDGKWGYLRSFSCFDSQKHENS